MPKKEYHTGVVRANDTDPMKRGVLVVECPTLVHGETIEASPSFHFVDSSARAGSFWIPNVGSQVEVEIEAEEDSEVLGLDPKWKCDVYPEGTVPEVFQTNYPNRRGWVTKEGHILYFDDTEDELVFYYEHPTGTKFYIDNDGEVHFDVPAGKKVYVGRDANHPISRGDILETYLEGLKDWIQDHIHGLIGTTDSGGTPPHVHTIALMYTNSPSPPPVPSIPTDLNSEDRVVD